MRIGVLVFLFVLSSVSFACGVSETKVVKVHEYHDGVIFVDFSKSTDCECSQKKRLAFRSSDEDKDFIKSMVLTAYVSDLTVSAYSNINTCDFHSNTAELTYFKLETK